LRIKAKGTFKLSHL